jgi:alkylation response protein AidB-like acyl-CoA dehydrogenase
MDARLSSEQRQLRDAAARLADDLGPTSVHDLADADRLARLEKAVESTGWRALRSDGASAVEVALVAEEFGRGLVDVPFLGPVLADELVRQLPLDIGACTVAVDDEAFEARGYARAVALQGHHVFAGFLGAPAVAADLTRLSAPVLAPLDVLGDVPDAAAARWQVLAVVATCADLLGAGRGAHALACDYAKVREQYGRTIGSYQAIAHLLAEGLALIEGSVSVLRYAAWAVDELAPEQGLAAARIAKLYCGRAARTVCETAIQVHGGIGNTWECLAHVHLRRVLTSTSAFPARLEDVHSGLS